MNIRKAFMQDIDDIMSIYEEALTFMRSIGNGRQWGEKLTLPGILSLRT